MIVRSSLGGDLLVLSTIFGLTNAIFSGRPARDSSARLIARVAGGRTRFGFGCGPGLRPAELFDGMIDDFLRAASL
jgi:hypothetical protein